MENSGTQNILFTTKIPLHITYTHSLLPNHPFLIMCYIKNFKIPPSWSFWFERIFSCFLVNCQEKPIFMRTHFLFMHFINICMYRIFSIIIPPPIYTPPPWRQSKIYTPPSNIHPPFEVVENIYTPGVIMERIRYIEYWM